VRKNTQKVEVASWSHDFGTLVEQLDLTGGIRYRAVFLISGSRWQNDVGDSCRVRQKHFVDDEQLQLSAAKSERPEMRQRIRPHHIQRFELSILRGLHHLRGG
jgi:hypothetical protein